MKARMTIIDVLRVIFLGGLFFVTLQITHGNEPYILHSINLIFHEAGHIVFIFFGDFIHFLGGTLGQLLIPIIVGSHLLRNADLFGVSIALWWFGTNLVDIGIYMSDARLQILQLLGGEHDWYYLFSKMNILNMDQTIGGIVIFLGNTLMYSALVFAFCIVFKKYFLRIQEYTEQK